MENVINIAKILKDCPKGMELDCLMYDNMTLMEVDDKDAIYPIKLLRSDGWEIELTKYGQYVDMVDAKCVIFPKGKTTWEGFIPPCKFKDGDVVVAEDIKRNQMFIVKEQISDCVAKCYIGYSFDNNKFFEEGNWRFDRVATEEEKQKLFQVIKDNGYKWNAETKTLEKLIKPRFKVGAIIQNEDKYKVKIIEVHKDAEYYIYESRKGIGRFSFTDQDKWELPPNKFDISTLKPFESRVLVRDINSDNWKGAFFSHYKSKKFYTISCSYYYQCIPYEGNEHLLDTTNDCDDFYKTW